MAEQENNTEEKEEQKPSANLPKKLETIESEKIRGRIVIFNPEKSEFAKNLKIEKPGDYIQPKK